MIMLKGKKNIFRASTFSFLIIFMLNAQLWGQAIDRKEQLESQKVAFITKQLNLNVEEAQKFWPVYNEFQSKKAEINKSRREILKKLVAENPELSDEELTQLSDSFVKLHLDEAKLAKTYHEKFKTVLPIKKVVAYYKSEQRFKRFLLKEVQNRKRGR